MGVDAKMLVVVKKNPLTPAAVQRLAYRISAAFGHEEFCIWRPTGRPGAWDEHGRRALAIVERYEQDGPDLLPSGGAQFIEVHLSGRYYGKGYERGNLPLYVGIATWLEENIPDAEICYGGDSSGICAEIFNKKAREELFAYYAREGHAPYVGAFRTLDDRSGRHCDFCDHPMIQYMWGRGACGFMCHGCGLKEESRDGGRTWAAPKPDAPHP